MILQNAAPDGLRIGESLNHRINPLAYGGWDHRRRTLSAQLSPSKVEVPSAPANLNLSETECRLSRRLVKTF
jgi:hypothetical protein